MFAQHTGKGRLHRLALAPMEDGESVADRKKSHAFCQPPGYVSHLSDSKSIKKGPLLTSVVHTELGKENINKAEQPSDTVFLDSAACPPSHWGLRLTHSSRGFWSCARLMGGPKILKKRLHFLWEAP